MNRMRAVVIREAGGPQVLELQERPVPRPGPGEVRVAVVAAGCNRADVLQRRGLYPAPPGVPDDVPGLEFAGHVAELGADVRGVREGDAVMGLVAGGAQAEQLVVDAAQLLPVPAGLDLVQAAALPEALGTAWDATVLQGGLAPGDVALIHAVGSGIGTAALQLVRALGATPIGTSRSARKLEACRDLGLQHAVLAADGRFLEALRALGLPRPRVILDTVGAAYLDQNLRALAPRGTLVTIGLLGGARAELDLGRLLASRATLVGSVLRSRPTDEKRALAAALRADVLPLVADGRVRPVIDATLTFDDVARAHERLEHDDTFGKLVLRWD